MQIKRGPGSEHNSLVLDLLWSDPDPPHKPLEGFRESPRGKGHLFGPNEVRAFCQSNGLDLIVRGHQCKAIGMGRAKDGRLVTTFASHSYAKIKKEVERVSACSR